MQRFPEPAHDAGRRGPLAVVDALICALFVAALAAPQVVSWVAPDASTAGREERRAADRPVWDGSLAALADFPAAYTAWYGDHFGLRPSLIELSNRVQWQLLERSPTDGMIRGQGDWLFTTVAHSVEVWRGRHAFSSGELEAWRELLEGRAAWCRERGAEYLFVIAPNKATIYPERMHPRYGAAGRSRMDQLVEHLAEHSTFRILDLRPTLLAAKDDFASSDSGARGPSPGDADGLHAPLYYPLGTHWNKRGATVAAAAILARVGQWYPSVTPPDPAAFRFTSTERQGDSWARRMYLDDVLFQANVDWEFPQPPRAASVPLDWGVPGRDVAFELPGDSDLPRAVILHDSFGEMLRPLFAEHFARTVAYWTTDFLTEGVEREAPDVVIQLLVERGLAALRPVETPLDSPEVLRREFDAARRPLCRIETRSDLGTHGAVTLSAPDPAAAQSPDGEPLARVSFEGIGAGVLTPELALLQPDEWALVRLFVSTPGELELWLLFQTEADRSFSRKTRFNRHRLAPGAHEVFFKLRVADLAGRLALETGGRGTLILHELAVVAVAR